MSTDLRTVDPASRPRILATAEDFDRAATIVDADDRASAWLENVRTRGEEILDEPPAEYELSDGDGVLTTNGAIFERALTLGFLYRHTDEEPYADRLWEELSAAASFPDWHPKQFLGTARLCVAFAAGLDWCHGYWSGEQRRTIRRAIVEHGLAPALFAYRGALDAPVEASIDLEEYDLPADVHTAWPTRDNNWNTVCNGGVAVGALSLLGDGDRDVAIEALEYARRSIERPLERMAPNGGWEEGASYWAFNSRFLAYYLSSLLNTLEADFGHAGRPGVAEVGTFPIYLTAPNGRPFNFADSGRDEPIDAPQLFYFARRFDRPEYAGYQLKHVGEDGDVRDLLWYDPECAVDPETSGLPLDRRFPEADECLTLRQRWNDPDAAFLGAKAGRNQTPHGDLDVGTFVYDVAGVRWAVDLGANDYGVPDYWDSGRDGVRWTYYRRRAEGHNTLVIDPDDRPDQDPFAEVAVDAVETGPEAAFARIDMSEAYGVPVERGIGLVDGRSTCLLRDEIDADGATVWWFVHTGVDVTVDGRTATLSQDGESIRAAVSTPTDASFEIRDAEPLPSSPHPAAEEPVTGVQKLAIRLDDVDRCDLTVLLGESVVPDAAVPPLSDWSVHELGALDAR